MVLVLTQVSAQKNWLIENFKTHLEKDKVQEYINKGEQMLSEMSEAEKVDNVYVMDLFKIMTGCEDTMIPVCNFDTALSLVDFEDVPPEHYYDHYYKFYLKKASLFYFNYRYSISTFSKFT